MRNVWQGDGVSKKMKPIATDNKEILKRADDIVHSLADLNYTGEALAVLYNALYTYADIVSSDEKIGRIEIIEEIEKYHKMLMKKLSGGIRYSKKGGDQ